MSQLQLIFHIYKPHIMHLEQSESCESQAIKISIALFFFKISAKHH